MFLLLLFLLGAAVSAALVLGVGAVARGFGVNEVCLTSVSGLLFLFLAAALHDGRDAVHIFTESGLMPIFTAFSA